MGQLQLLPIKPNKQNKRLLLLPLPQILLATYPLVNPAIADGYLLTIYHLDNGITLSETAIISTVLWKRYNLVGNWGMYSVLKIHQRKFSYLSRQSLYQYQVSNLVSILLLCNISDNEAFLLYNLGPNYSGGLEIDAGSFHVYEDINEENLSILCYQSISTSISYPYRYLFLLFLHSTISVLPRTSR